MPNGWRQWLRVALIAALSITILVLTSLILSKVSTPNATAGSTPPVTAAPTPQAVPAPGAQAQQTPAAASSAPTLLPLTPQASPAPDADPAAQAAWRARNEPGPRVTSDPDYSFFWFTDTQYYSESYPDTFHSMTKWMREKAALYNVQYAFFTGDFVQEDSDTAQWAVADEAIKTLEGTVPVFAVAGNHDTGTSEPDYGHYLKYFGEKRFEGNPHIVEWYENGKGRCDAVEIGGTKYLFVGFGYDVDLSHAMRWANKKLAAYPEHHAILLFHDYMTSEGLLSTTGTTIFKNVVRENPNVFMVLCGHRYNSTVLITDIDDDGDNLRDRSVYNVMMNFQAFENGGDGYLTLIRVYKKDRMITFDAYSPTQDDWYRKDPARTSNKERLVLPVTIFD